MIAPLKHPILQSISTFSSSKCEGQGRRAKKMSLGLKFINLLLIMMVFSAINCAWAWQYTVSNEVKPGQSAELSLVAPSTLKEVVVTLRSDRSKGVITKRLKQLSASKPTSIKFKPPKDVSHWVVEVKGQSSEGPEQVVFEFDVLSAGPMQIKFFNEESSLEEGRLIFQCSRPLDRVELEAFGDNGELQWEDKVSVKKIKGGRLEAIFQAREETPRRLEIKAVDTVGTWQSFRVVRWYAELPHEDVLFSSGDAEVSSDELSKLKKAALLVEDEIGRFRKAMGDPNAQVDLQLYVAGYTDTVGDRAKNVKLSSARALSISKSFRQLGVDIQIKYIGYGEEGLLVKTDDSTDEPRNRRAAYIVANSAPIGPYFPSGNWRNLK